MDLVITTHSHWQNNTSSDEAFFCISLLDKSLYLAIKELQAHHPWDSLQVGGLLCSSQQSFDFIPLLLDRLHLVLYLFFLRDLIGRNRYGL